MKQILKEGSRGKVTEFISLKQLIFHQNLVCSTTYLGKKMWETKGRLAESKLPTLKVWWMCSNMGILRRDHIFLTLKAFLAIRVEKNY